MDLLVLKKLLSVVASISLQIHDDCLLQIVRTCYNIYLGSKNILNKTKGERSVLSLFRFHLHCPVVYLLSASCLEDVEKVEAEDYEQLAKELESAFLLEIMTRRLRNSATTLLLPSGYRSKNRTWICRTYDVVIFLVIR
ncbi:putative mon2, dimerization and cyclophilin-binding domain-containing protein [Rosa chinensis]|uniref:Putative mon2, dimerization and cyclophilin-binding domain-containing protein n=1 Tax=Rosa chinensis TaxID=74649 RepID=A0A2P6PE15_ROSCH|nr:putative mon2, dimerization and cyclophilin-binding domain-containing protein [Rosa chinensis]